MQPGHPAAAPRWTEGKRVLYWLEKERNSIKIFLSSRVFVASLCVLAAVDLAFILVHVTFSHWRFDIERDGSFSEMSEHLEMALCAVLTTACFARTRQPIYLGMAAIYVCILFDNKMGLHEDLGGVVSSLFPAAGASPLPGQALGELAIFAAFAMAGSVLGPWSWQRSTGEHRAAGSLFALLIAALAVFAVGVDGVHEAFSERAKWLVGVVEDGGEMLVLSAHCAFVLSLYSRLKLREWDRIVPV